jgi:glucosamine--fructose-6-phosphate aminotransferase (isomerizing)
VSRYDVAKLSGESVLTPWRAQAATTYPGWLYSGGALRVFGMGGSFNAALTAADRLRRAGVDVRVELASEYYRTSLSGIGPADTIVLISTSGESIELVELAERLRAEGFTRTLALVGEPGTPLAAAAAHEILLGLEDENPIDSFIATVIALVRMGAAIRGTALPEIQADVDAVERAVEAGRRFAEGNPAPSVDVLGRGHLLGVAQQVSLLLREISRVPATSWEPNTFRHGPMESIQADQLTILLRSAMPETRAVDLALARDLRMIPQRALIVGSDAAVEGDAESSAHPADDLAVPGAPTLPGVPELAALIPLIYSWGEQAGVEPGEFRYTRVTITADS